MDLTIDFEADWIQTLRAELLSWGYSAAATIPNADVPFTYYSVLRRRPLPGARRVHRAPNLACPPDLQGGLDAVLNKLEQGGDFIPHLSTRLVKLGYKDRLLNDWGILHFHLGTRIGANGFVDRTGPLLFARITEDAAYAIGVGDHESFTDIRLLEDIHRNWPESLAGFRLPCVRSIAPLPMDAESIGSYRQGGIAMLVQMQDGTVYAPPGGMLTTSGDSAEAVRDGDWSLRLVRRLEDWVKSNVNSLVTSVHQAAGVALESPLTLRLRRFDARLFAFDERTGTAILIYDRVR